MDRPVSDEDWTGVAPAGYDLAAAGTALQALPPHFDPLIGGRRAFTAAVAQALANGGGRPLAVLLLDLDRFRYVTASLGQVVGCALLDAVATRLADTIGTAGLLARHESDEFAVALPDLAGADQALQVAAQVLRAFDAPFAIGGRELFVTASVGLCVHPEDGASADTLVQRADLALYWAKQNGRNGVQRFQPGMSQEILRRLTQENDLRQALRRGEFRLFYQPLFAANSGRLMGMEALLRWFHPTLGLLGPDEFLPLAEDTGLILPIGEWALRQACVQNKAWQSSGLPLVPVTVNLSVSHFHGTDIGRLVVEVLGETGLAPAFLGLELTESVIVDRMDTVFDALAGLRALGVKIALDDFGTGYSSLSYLKRFPLDTLKIDRSFVRDVPHDAEAVAVVKAVIALARAVNLAVVAEGVETRPQMEFMRDFGSDAVQGFFSGRPLPAAEFEVLLRSGHGLERALVRDPRERAPECAD